jgi:hypothetical protein
LYKFFFVVHHFTKKGCDLTLSLSGTKPRAQRL